jgi:hypothetical protein
MIESSSTKAAQTTVESSDGLLLEPFVRATIKQQIASFVALGAGLGLAVTATPDIAALFGVSDLLDSLSSYLPGQDLSTVRASKALVGLFVFLLVFAVGSVLSVVLGAITGSRSSATAVTAAVGTGIGSFAGYTIMFVAVTAVGSGSLPRVNVGVGDALSAVLGLSAVTAAVAYVTVTVDG